MGGPVQVRVPNVVLLREPTGLLLGRQREDVEKPVARAGLGKDQRRG